MIDTNLLRDNAYCESFSAGQSIFLDYIVRKLYVVISGRVGAYDESGALQESFTAGQPFATAFFFTGSCTQNFRAEEDSVVFALAADTFDTIARDYPQILLALLREAYAPEEPPAPAPAKWPGMEAAAKPAAALQPAALQQKMAAPDAPAPAVSVQTAPASVDPPLFPAGHKRYPGVQKPEYEKYLFDKEYRCPCCSKTFRGRKIFTSKLVPSSPTRYDLRRYFKNFQMEWYDVITCPNCYFSAPTEYFLEPGRFLKAKIRDRLAAAKKSVTLDFTAARDLDFVFTAHYLALLCAPAYSSNEQQIRLRLWSNLSWLYEDMGDAEMERLAAAKAAETGEALFTAGSLNPFQEQVVSLQIAGMLYRTGEREKVMHWVFQAKTAKMGKKVYATLAEDLWEIIRAEKR